MPTRYDTRRIFFNQEPLYDKLFEERHIKGVRHYSTPTLRYPTATELADVTRKRHIWKVGDRFFKLAIHYYGSAQYWWVIALFNKTPTEADLTTGETVFVPLPLENILRLYNRD